MSLVSISLVIPIFNEEDSIPVLWKRIKDTLATHANTTGDAWEVVFIDDGSKDKSLECLLTIQQAHANVTVIEFNRNYGQHAAIIKGFESIDAQTKYVITLDADLQNPPEDIPSLVNEMKKGYDVVGGVRVTRSENDSFWRRWPSRLVNLVTRKTTGVALSDYGCMLRGYSKEVIDSVLRCDEKNTFIPVLANTFAKSITEIPVGHAAREFGESKYGLLSLIRLQFDLMTGFGTFPLQMVTATGLVISFFSLSLGLYIGYQRISGVPDNTQGVFTLFAILFFFIGILFLSLGILGEYISRIYSQVRARPRSIVKEVHKQ